MAGLTSGDRPVGSTNGGIEGQQESHAHASEPVEQTLANSEQRLADSDQTLSDADQTSSDRDQTSADSDQLAADSDQAASDRDLASGVDPGAHEFSRNVRERTTREREQTARQREQTARRRLQAAARRDTIAHARDLAARARDQAAEARDLAIAQREAAQQGADACALTGTDRLIRAAGQRTRAAERRAQAAEQRTLTAQDRQAAAQDRERAAHERLRALVDREALARQIALAETDQLTGARARSAGLTDLDHELDRCRRTGGRLVVAYVDVVGLKTVNDTQGRAAGDELLKRVVTFIKAHLRSYDLIIRLGGDEFLCAMSDMNLTEARRRFGAIADALAAEPDESGGAIRTGFAQLAPDEIADELIARADSELIDSRRGEHGGRSRSVAEAPVTAEP